MIKYNKMQIICFIVLAVMIFSLTYTSAINNREKKERFVATNEYDENIAIQNGCEKLPGYKRLKVFLCEDKIGKKLKLEKDMKVYALDMDMNGLVGADNAWSQGYTGEGVRIAILDTGVDYTHPEIASSYVGGHDILNGDNDPMDDEGHGTIIAGLITSDGIDQRSKGVAPDADIVAIKIMDENGSGALTNLVEAIYSAVDDYDVDIISISIGTAVTSSVYCDDRTTLSRLTRDAINYAHSRGVNVVVGAGNGGDQPSFPGCLSKALSIGAVDENFDIATFSARGFIIDMYAPGVDIYTPGVGGLYEINSGTSLSAPFVAGAIALLRDKNSGLDYDTYEDALIDGATQKDTSIGMIKILNVSGAIENIEEPVVCDMPALSSSYRNGKFVTSWESKVGCSYSLEERENLFSGGWVGIASFNGTGNRIEYAVDPTGAMKFYRVTIIMER